MTYSSRKILVSNLSLGIIALSLGAALFLAVSMAERFRVNNDALRVIESKGGAVNEYIDVGPEFLGRFRPQAALAIDLSRVSMDKDIIEAILSLDHLFSIDMSDSKWNKSELLEIVKHHTASELYLYNTNLDDSMLDDLIHSSARNEISTFYVTGSNVTENYILNLDEDALGVRVEDY